MHNLRNKITFLSLLMSILIILRHAVNIETYNVDGIMYYIQLFISHLTDTIVPCFFAISAFLFYQNYSTDKLKDKLLSRIKSIIIPFTLWSFIGYLYIIIINAFLGEHLNMSIPPFEPIQTFLNIFIYTKYNLTWFLLNLIIYTYTFPILYDILKLKVGGLILIFVLLGLGYMLQNNKIMYAAPYALGALFGIHYKSLVQKKYSSSIQKIALIVFISLISVETLLNIEQGINLIPLRLLQIILIWIMADRFAINYSPKWWMTISFFIYCSHSMILESIQKLISIFCKTVSYVATIDFIVAPILTLITIFILAFFLRKNKHLWSALNGGR